MPAIYQADVWCDDCADSIKDRICDELWDSNENAPFKGDPLCPDGRPVSDFTSRDELSDYLDMMDHNEYDSDEYPKDYPGGNESDCPDHCGAHAGCLNAIELSDGSKIGAWLENDLTSDGVDYVKQAVREGGEVAELWREWYSWIDFPVEPTIPVDSIKIPGWVMALCEGWHGGQECMLYAVCSTGGLTTGTMCPISDFDDYDDRDRKWYLTIWNNFSGDLGYAARAARRDNHEDAAELSRAGKWADEVCERLADDYGLEDW